ncbi:MAG: SPFH domain-containing protein [Cytophagaceae bacterium]|nr:SPFH domain-containing protein [Cytophagaceae bacterium]
MNEHIVKPLSGFLFLLLSVVLVALAVLGGILWHPLFWFLLFFALFLLSGVFVLNPNEANLLVFFGKYVGTVRDSGFFWANPFYVKTQISLKARNFETDKIKVNDKLGNPIIIGAVVVWKVGDTAKARFEVDNYEHFVKLQCDTAVRHLAGSYSYDHFDDEEKEITLRSGGDFISGELERELRERLVRAGVEIFEARITHLVYAEEIAHAMLQRQQATAMVAARTKIVEGAVGMVELALNRLAAHNVVELDEDKKAAMVSNLMVVLCSDRSVSPVVNTGTLHQ